jgi:hypothetical protein
MWGCLQSRSIEEHMKEQEGDLWLCHLKSLAVAEYSRSQGHQIGFDNAVALAKLPHCNGKR